MRRTKGWKPDHKSKEQVEDILVHEFLGGRRAITCQKMSLPKSKRKEKMPFDRKLRLCNFSPMRYTRADDIIDKLSENLED